jgi:hypothetical protein
MGKYVERSPLSDAETAARKLIEIANGVEAIQDGRIHIEKINGPFLYEIKGTPAQYLAGLKAGHRARLARSARVRHLHHALHKRADLFA